jgi:hypothetical protein
MQRPWGRSEIVREAPTPAQERSILLPRQGAAQMGFEWGGLCLEAQARIAMHVWIPALFPVRTQCLDLLAIDETQQSDESPNRRIKDRKVWRM